LLAGAALGCLACLAAGAPGAGPVAEATAVVAQLQAGLLDADRRESGAGAEPRFAAFAPLIDASHDLAAMARLSLGSDWQGLSPREQAQYIAAFRRRSVQDYATRFRDSAGASFRVEGAREARGGRVAVSAWLEARGESAVRLDYLLQPTPSGWRIVNIVAAGVSELALQRTQFQRVLRESGFEALLGEVSGGGSPPTRP
jgi:phospholipid transport system substrate-binding protein